MRTRILHTKIWKDSYFSQLNRAEKISFIYLLTNESVNLSGTYELNVMELKMWCGLTDIEIVDLKEKFTKDKKFIFYKDWVKIVNHERYNTNYTGAKNEVALEKELSYIPNEIIENLDSLFIDYRYPSDSTINHKSEIINKKSKTINQKQAINEFENEAKELLLLMNNLYDKKYSSYQSWIGNYKKLREDYSFEDFKLAVSNIKYHEWLSGKKDGQEKIDMVIITRTNKDWIGDLISLSNKQIGSQEEDELSRLTREAHERGEL